jgi:transcriptional regulator with XRE-family HTH domain
LKAMDEWLTRPGGLATNLRMLRRTAGYTGDQFARLAGWTQSKISKIETGKQLPTDEDLSRWVRLCNASERLADLQASMVEAIDMHHEYRQRMRLGQVAVQRGYADLIRDATVIRNAESVVIPGLLQVRDYVTARIDENVRLYGTDPAEVQAAVTERLRRQDALYDQSKQFEFVITEAALYLLLCPPAAMLTQLDRLLVLTTGSMNNVTLGIVPFGQQLSTTPQHGFLLLDNEYAIVETISGESVHQGDAAIVYVSAMDDLMSQAATGSAARQLIIQAVGRMKS